MNELLDDNKSIFIRKHFAVILRYKEDGLEIEDDVLARAQEAMDKHKARWAVHHSVSANTSTFPDLPF